MPHSLVTNKILPMEEIQRSLGRVEGKLDFLIDTMTNHDKLDITRFQELDVRVSSLEKKVWMAAGIVSVFSFAAAHFPFAMLFGK